VVPCSDDILAVGIVEGFMALGGDDDKDKEEDACTMRCSKDSEKAAVQLSSRRNRAASKSRLHVWTFAFGESDTRMLLLSSFATGAGKDDDAVVVAVPAVVVPVCGASVSTLVAVTRSINAHICTGVAMMLREFVPVLPEWLPSCACICL
jgi:hypothetical protein